VALAQGDRLGRYRIVAPIGAGGMGEVYRAHDEQLGRDVAIKVLPVDFAADPERLKRFEREARATAALSHPNILAVYDVGTHDGAPFLVEELLEGESLRERLERGSLDPGEAMRIAAGIAKGLAAAHDRGIVHRDLKPGNVFLTRDSTAKILDFGLARLVESPGGPEPADATTLAASTQLGAVLGTVAYMAPEQARGLPADRRADVFAFGVVLYEMLSGERPFQGSTTTDTLASILKEEPTPLPAVVPPTVAAVVTRCLAKDPGRRYQGGGELKAALEAIQTGAAVAPASRWPATGARRLWLVGAALLVAAVVTVLVLDVGGLRQRLAGGGPAARIASIAVLPLENLSGDPDQDYLAEGMHEALITELAQLSGLERVIGRASVARFRGSTQPLGEIARDLKVGALITGAVQRSGDRVRVTAHLIDPATEVELWTRSYERSLRDVLSLQDEIIGAITREIGIQLTAQEQTRLTTARPVNPDAYEAYLKGSYQWKKLTPAGVDAAQSYFESALAKDASYAQAHEGLAWVWAVRQQMGFMPPSEAGPRAKAEALEAIRLDEGSAASHEVLAALRTWSDWDWAGAETEWRRALALNPNSANSHGYYAHFLAHTGRTDEAIPHAERALGLDPLNALYHSLYAVILLYDHRFVDALAAARAGIALQPDHPAALFAAWYAASGCGRHSEAVAAAKTYLKVCYADPGVDQALEEGWNQGGYKEAMSRAAAALAARFSTSYALPTDIGGCYVEAGMPDQALDWLEKAYQVRDSNLPYVGLPLYDPLRGDPRFQDLLRRMNLPVQ